MDFDSNTRQILQTVYPELRARVFRIYQDVFMNLGLTMRATRGLSSMEEQRQIWMKGRNESGAIVDPKGVVTYATPGDSLHNYGFAVDSCFRGLDPYLALEPDQGLKSWNEFGRIAQQHGLEWGGTFKHFDGPHIQMRFGLDISYVKELYAGGGIKAVWTKADAIVRGG